MKCPSCATPLDAPAPRCPHCKLSLHKLDSVFGMVPAHSRFFTDRSGTLALDEIKRIRTQLSLFHQKFPQALLSVVVTELAGGGSAAEFAFWMANRARFTSAEKTRGDNFNLLLAIDLTGRAAALTTGYGLEKHVPEEALQSALNEFARAQREHGVAAGIKACIASLVRQLRELADEAKGEELQEAQTGSDSW